MLILLLGQKKYCKEKRKTTRGDETGCRFQQELGWERKKTRGTKELFFLTQTSFSSLFRSLLSFSLSLMSSSSWSLLFTVPLLTVLLPWVPRTPLPSHPRPKTPLSLRIRFSSLSFSAPGWFEETERERERERQTDRRKASEGGKPGILQFLSLAVNFRGSFFFFFYSLSSFPDVAHKLGRKEPFLSGTFTLSLFLSIFLPSFFLPGNRVKRHEKVEHKERASGIMCILCFSVCKRQLMYKRTGKERK